MRFLVDECTGPKVAQWLHSEGHEVVSVFEDHRGLDDEYILQRAQAERRILITNDQDFGERVFRRGETHDGIILLRLQDERSVVKIETLQRVLSLHSDKIIGRFVVASETRIRIT